MSYESEMGERYAKELDEAAEILTRIHPIGRVKALGRLEVVAALKELFPANIATTAQPKFMPIS